MSKYKWIDEVVKLSELKPVEYNPRKANKKAKKSYEESYQKYGLLDVVVVNNDGSIIGGHQKYFAAVERGDETIEVSRCSEQMSIEDEKALNVKLNSVRGFTVMQALKDFGYSKESLDELGFREFKMPEIKLDDVAVVVPNKEKNKSVLALFFKTDELIMARDAIKKIINEQDDVLNTSEAIKYLIKHHG